MAAEFALKPWRLGAVLLALAVALSPSHARAAEPSFPALTGRVVDDAELLGPDVEEELTEELKALEDKSSDQLVVVTLPSLQGYTIEDYGYQLGRRWGIGTAKLSNGVLLIVAPNEHKVRIEVGYGLEGTLTDALSKIIIENAILPKFRAGDYAGGIKDGVGDIIKVLTGDAAEVEDRAKARPDADEPTIDWVMIIFWVLMLSWIAYSIYRNARYASVADKGRRGRGWSGPVFIPGPGWDGGGSSGGWSSGGGGGGFSGGGGSFGGGGASGGW
ncbi:MAG TPA: TPM domain-containing protein [Gemmatimonadales bacterium]|nr:TPM domain-containing protein [Gemmatimonadales bacterium]